MRRIRRLLLVSTVVPFALSTSSYAGETITYTYDAQGRLVNASHSGTVNSGVSTSYTFDKADNRTNVTVTGAADIPSFSIDSVSVSEGGTATFTVTKSGTATGTLSVDYATADGTAVAGSDYLAASNTLTFLQGDTSKTISVATLTDAITESAETFTVALSGNSAGSTIGTGTGTGTINDVAPGPSFSIANAPAVTEGGNLVYTVTKSGTTSSTFTVNYATANGTATAGTDYTAASGTLTFTSAQTSKTITVPTTNDTANESNETVLVNLSGPSGNATITDAQATGTINDDDGPKFSISNATAVNEGTALTFTVTKTGSATSSYTVNYATANGTATAGSDYTAASGTLTFTSAQTSKTVTVSTTDDTTNEPSETLLVNLSSPSGNSTITTSQGTGTINASDGPVFSISNATAVTEGTVLTFTVTKTGGGAGGVSYATANGTATAGSDYNAASGTLSFAALQTSQTFTVSTINDTTPESAETVLVNLSAPTGPNNNATIGTSQASGTINDNDAANQPPTTVNDTLSVQQCHTAATDVLANDTDPEGNYPLGLTGVLTGNGAAYATTTVGSSIITFNAPPLTGTKQVIYEVQDSLGNKSTGTLTVSISGICNQ